MNFDRVDINHQGRVYLGTGTSHVTFHPAGQETVAMFLWNTKTVSVIPWESGMELQEFNGMVECLNNSYTTLGSWNKVL